MHKVSATLRRGHAIVSTGLRVTRASYEHAPSPAAAKGPATRRPACATATQVLLGPLATLRSALKTAAGTAALRSSRKVLTVVTARQDGATVLRCSTSPRGFGKDGLESHAPPLAALPWLRPRLIATELRLTMMLARALCMALAMRTPVSVLVRQLRAAPLSLLGPAARTKKLLSRRSSA